MRGNTLDGALRSEAGGMEVIEADARYVDGAGREDVGISQDRLVGFIGLNALLEAAAVGYASKDARDKLRIIRVTEAAEYLILSRRD